MRMDSFNGVLPPQILEVKLEKKKEPVETKPVEKLAESHHQQFEMQKQQVSKETRSEQVADEEQKLLQTYNAKGNWVKKSIRHGHKQKADPVHLTV